MLCSVVGFSLWGHKLGPEDGVWFKGCGHLVVLENSSVFLPETFHIRYDGDDRIFRFLTLSRPRQGGIVRHALLYHPLGIVAPF